MTTLLAATTPWTDPNYSLAQAMYGKTEIVSWTRMESYFPTSAGYTLFQGNTASSVGIDDTIQGSLGDCWLLAMIASVAEFPDRIYNMFDTKAYNTKGSYSIKMYEMGVPISVVIDDFLPINTSWADNQFSWVNV